MTDTPAPAPAPTPAPAVAPAKTWYDGADAETVGFLQNRGWDKLDASKAGLEAVKSYREASKVVGAPADQLLRLPAKPDDLDGWNKIHSRLGMPETADKYDFSNVKFADGSELDTGTAKEFRDLAHDLKLDPARASLLAERLAKMADLEESTESSTYEANVAKEKDTLSKNWGFNQAQNMIVAKNAAAALGVSGEEVAALEKTVGYARTMEMFRNIGARIGSDKFIVSGGQGGNQPMTVEGAQARLSELTNDNAWRTRFMSNEITAKKEFEDLTALIAAGKR